MSIMLVLDKNVTFANLHYIYYYIKKESAQLA